MHLTAGRQIELSTNSSAMKAAERLKRLSLHWKNRAQIRKFDFFEQTYFKKEALDFPTSLLPFHQHPIFINAPEEVKQRILSCAWIIYNGKTLSIENDIIVPASSAMLKEKVPGLNDFSIKQVISETMIDESFHILLTINAIKWTAQYRGLNLHLHEFNLIRKMQLLQNHYHEKWKKNLVLLATAVVSEIFISDYLRLISDNKTIQPLNQLSVQIHRDDELTHSSIFKNLCKYIYSHLSPKEKIFFGSVLPKPVRWFADQECLVWKSALKQIKFKYSNMLNDTKALSSPDYSLINYSELLELADELGLMENAICLDSFYEEGLFAKV